MCEEVQEPATQVPKAMVATIFINTFAGLLFLIPLMFVMPAKEIADIIASGQPVPYIIKAAVGSPGGAIGLLIPLMVLALICGIGCTTAASRCVWAFARDGAIPGSGLWIKVNRNLDVPLNAMMLSMAVQIILGVINFGSDVAFNAFSGVGVICLTAAYATPIAINMLSGRVKTADAAFKLGKFGYFANFVAVGMYLACHLPLPNDMLTRPSLVASCPAALLHAPVLPRHRRRQRQLCLGRLCRRHGHLCPLVRRLGPPQLRRSPRPGAPRPHAIKVLGVT